MLWHKAWVDTRWRFLLGLALLLVFACGSSLTFPRVRDFLASIQLPVVTDEEAAAAFRESLELTRTFRGYAWSQWFAQNFPVLLTIMAALLGSGSSLVKGGSGALFSLALPVSRGKWISSRAGNTSTSSRSALERWSLTPKVVSLSTSSPHRSMRIGASAVDG